MKQTNERLCALAQKGDAAALDSLISSIFNRDYPVIQTYVLLIGVLFVLFNLLFDILQTVSDPRLRKED